MSKVLRTVKNVVKNYTIPEVKTREATSNDPWFASAIELDELAQHTYHPKSQHEIYQILYKRLNDHPKYWRHVLKSLIVFEYVAFHGHNDMYRLLTTTLAVMNSLTTFMFVDKDGRDKGNFIRERAKRMVKYIEDPSYFKAEKEKSIKTKQRNHDSFVSTGISGHGSSLGLPTQVDRPDYAPRTAEEEDLQLQLALAISKQEAQEMRTQSHHSESNDSSSDRFDAFALQSSNKNVSEDRKKISSQPQQQLIDVFSEEFDHQNKQISSPNVFHTGGGTSSALAQSASVPPNEFKNDIFNVFGNQQQQLQQPFFSNNNTHMTHQGFDSFTTPSYNSTFINNNNIPMNQPISAFANPAINYEVNKPQQQLNNDDFDNFIQSPSPFESVASNMPKYQYPDNTNKNDPISTINNDTIDPTVNTPKSEAFKFVEECGLVDLSSNAFKNPRRTAPVEKKYTLNDLARNNSSCDSFANDPSFFVQSTSATQNQNFFNTGNTPIQQPRANFNPFASGSQTSLPGFGNFPPYTPNQAYSAPRGNPFEDNNGKPKF